MCPLKNNKNKHMKLKALIVVFCLVGLNIYAQNSLNAYKYIIVPKKFDFQKTDDKYQLNSLTKFLFNKEGFATLFDGDKMPKELFDNPCFALRANVKDQSKMFSTKAVIELLDCRNTVIFTSAEGRSKEKEFKKGYQEAIRRAFESIKALDYKYDVALAATVKPKIETPTQIPDSQPKIVPVIESQPKIEEVNPVEKQIESIEEEVVEDTTANEELDKNTIEVAETTKVGDMLYAQAKPFGFQLVDSEPRVVYSMQKTSLKDVYILKNKNGIIHKKNEKWVAEYYENNQLIQKELTIKF